MLRRTERQQSHHIAIAAAHRILRKGGRVAILGLAQPQFERARELYADHRLGFSEVQLHKFLESAGFKNIEVTVVSREKQSPHFESRFCDWLSAVPVASP